MLFKYKNGELEPLAFYNFADLEGKEKDLENLLAKKLGDLFTEDSQLMPIHQERPLQSEPDLCALDKDGNLIIFELKRGVAQEATTIQIMRYTQEFGQMKYSTLEKRYQNYKDTEESLREAHAETFGLDNPLPEDSFNKHQKMVIVGSSLDSSLMAAVDYWQSKKLDIDFLPYRFYEIEGEIYFDFFAKPYDYHINPKDKKGILFDTNRSYNQGAIWDMFAKSKISAYGDASRFIHSFNKGDYVLYYHKGWGVVGAGIIKTSTVGVDSSKGEKYLEVDLLTPVLKNDNDIRYISASDLRKLLDKNFYYANTTKRPYLSVDEAKLVVEELKKKYETLTVC